MTKLEPDKKICSLRVNNLLNGMSKFKNLKGKERQKQQLRWVQKMRFTYKNMEFSVQHGNQFYFGCAFNKARKLQ